MQGSLYAIRDGEYRIFLGGCMSRKEALALIKRMDMDGDFPPGYDAEYITHGGTFYWLDEDLGWMRAFSGTNGPEWCRQAFASVSREIAWTVNGDAS